MVETKITDQLDKEGKVIDKIIEITRYTPNIQILSKTEVIKRVASLEAQILALQTELNEYNSILLECK